MCMYVESFELSDTHLSNRLKSVYAEYLYENPPITKHYIRIVTIVSKFKEL